MSTLLHCEQLPALMTSLLHHREQFPARPPFPPPLPTFDSSRFPLASVASAEMMVRHGQQRQWRYLRATWHRPSGAVSSCRRRRLEKGGSTSCPSSLISTYCCKQLLRLLWCYPRAEQTVSTPFPSTPLPLASTVGVAMPSTTPLSQHQHGQHHQASGCGGYPEPLGLRDSQPCCFYSTIGSASAVELDQCLGRTTNQRQPCWSSSCCCSIGVELERLPSVPAVEPRRRSIVRRRLHRHRNVTVGLR